ncbi:MAG TPA: hypothetical protein VF503_25995 [Sphingobium sp.]|uniref:hypothetical protein n=1 Tax=Sphingobium sp. TaxID=1912891 RepID=UPI002ED232E0
MRRNSQMRLRMTGCAMAITAMAGLATPGHAAPYTMDEAFRASLEGVQASLAQGDTTGAQQRAQTLIGSANQPLEKYAAGELMLQAAAGNGDLRAQRSALNTILESGQASASETARLRAIAGTLSAMLGDRKDAIAQIDYANGQGYSSVASQLALADAKFTRNDPVGGEKALDEAFALRAKEQKPIEASWYDRAIALGYKAKRPDLVARWTQAKLATYPSAPNWRSGIVNYLNSANTEPDQSLDLYRLMAATDSIASERDWLAYSALAAQKGTAAEAKAALDTGVSSGNLSASDPATAKELATLKPKAAKALAELPGLTAKAKSGNGAAALTAADAQFAAAAYPAAAELYRAALSKGGIDANRATTRLGIALTRSGDLAGGKTALASVTQGPWATVAGFWSVWNDRKAIRNPQ